MTIEEIEVLLEEAVKERVNFEAPFWPYYFEIEGKNQRLFYFGANHSHDPNNEQYPVLEEKWDQFVKQIDPKKTLVVTEGGRRKLDVSSSKESILSGSEGGFIAYLASKHKIVHECFEIKNKNLNNLMAQSFPRRFVVFYWFCNYVDGWHRKGRNYNESFEEKINRSLGRDKDDLDWTDVDFTLSGMKNVFKELFPGKEFDSEDSTLYYELARPNGKVETQYQENPYIINEISRKATFVRDSYVIKGIYDKWQEGYSMFVPFGSGHCIEQEPVLRKILK